MTTGAQNFDSYKKAGWPGESRRAEMSAANTVANSAPWKKPMRGTSCEFQQARAGKKAHANQREKCCIASCSSWALASTLIFAGRFLPGNLEGGNLAELRA